MHIKKENKKKLLRFLNNKLFISLIVIILVLFWWGASLVLSPETSFKVLKHEYSFDKYQSYKLLIGNKIFGEFKSPDDYLGIVYVNFNNYIKPDYLLEDELLFRFKEKNSKTWQYEQKYRSGYFENLNLFPFGIPVINDSKNKIYDFEITSLKGNDSNALSISSTDPKIISSHFFPTNFVKQNLISFLISKSLNSLTRVSFFLSSVIFALPLIYFLLAVLLIKKQNLLKEKFVLLTLFLIIVDIFFIKLEYFGVLFALAGCYLASIKSNRLGSSISFFIGLTIVVVWTILTFLGFNTFSSKLNVWAYLFMVIGIVQVIVENKKGIENLKDYEYFLKKAKKSYEKLRLRK